MRTLIRVKVEAGAGRERIEALRNGFRISVKEEAKEGRANARVKELLARELGVPTHALRLIKGAKAPAKLFSVTME